MAVGHTTSQRLNRCDEFFRANPQYDEFRRQYPRPSPNPLEVLSACGFEFGRATINVFLLPYHLWNLVSERLSENAEFERMCENEFFEACKRRLALEAALFVPDSELREVSIGELLRKREQVRALAARDETYRRWAVSRGVPLPNIEDRNDSLQQATALVEMALRSVTTRYQCYDNEARIAMTCYGLGTLLGPTAVVRSALTMGRAANAMRLSNGLQTTGQPVRAARGEAQVTLRESPAPRLHNMVEAQRQIRNEIEESVRQALPDPQNLEHAADALRLRETLNRRLVDAALELPESQRQRFFDLIRNTRSQALPEPYSSATGFLGTVDGGPVRMVMSESLRRHPYGITVAGHEFRHGRTIGVLRSDNPALQRQAIDESLSRRLGLYREELGAFTENYEVIRQTFTAADLPRLERIYSQNGVSQSVVELAVREGILVDAGGGRFTTGQNLRAAMNRGDLRFQELYTVELNAQFLRDVRDALSMNLSEFRKARVRRPEYQVWQRERSELRQSRERE